MAYRGLETGHRDIATHVIRQNDIFFVFQSPLNPGEKVLNAHIAQHGDGVRDVAFAVDDARLIFQKAVEAGAKAIHEPWVEKDADGEVVMASIATVSQILLTDVNY